MFFSSRIAATTSLVEPVDHRFRRSGRTEEAEPRIGAQARDALLDCGRGIGNKRSPLLAELYEGAQVSGFDLGATRGAELMTMST